MKACAIFAVAAIPFAFASVNAVDASADTTTPTASEFYMTEGAAVRTTSDEVGIRFNATITKTYWEALQTAYGADATYSFYSKVTDGTTPITKDYGTLTPDFTSADEYTFYTTIVYTTDELESAGLLDEACELELSAQTYVDVTMAGETEPTTIAAYGTTGKRSMKAVANAAALAGNTDEDLAKYFTVGNRSEAIECYSFSDKSGAVNMKAMPAWTNDMEVYYGAEKLNAALDAKGNISFTGFELPEGQTEGYMSVFNGSTVYSAKVSTALKITKDTVAALQTPANYVGAYMVLMEDIDMEGATWSDQTRQFDGTLDGNGHVIKNFTIPNWGFFEIAKGTIKNIGFVRVTMASGTNIIAARTSGNLTLENIFIDVATFVDATSVNGIIALRSQEKASTFTMTNVVASMPSSNAKMFGAQVRYATELTNVYTIGMSNSYATTTATQPTLTDCGRYADLAEFNGATKTLTPFLTSCVAKYFNNAQ